MSADNWRVCPKCTAKSLAGYDEKVKQLDEATKKIQEAYGRVPLEEYMTLINKTDKSVQDIEVLELEDTLREDYEIYIDDAGEFSVNYSASCSVCKFSFTFKHTQKALPPVSG